MATNGNLNFTNVNKVTFEGVGAAPNAVIDTTTGKIGVGVDSPDANLHVVGNCHVSTNMSVGGVLNMGVVNVAARHTLEAITSLGASTPSTLTLTNTGTSLVASGDVTVATNTFHVDTTNNRVGVGTTSPKAKFHNNGDFFIAANSENWTSITGKGLHIRYSTNASQDQTFIQSRDRSADVRYPIQFDASNFEFAVGNVGVGSANPQTKLQTNGDFLIAADSAAWSTTAGKGLFIRYSTNSNQDATYIQSIDRSNGNAYYPMIFYGSRFDFEVGDVKISNGLTVSGSNITSDDRIKFDEENVSNALTLMSQLTPQKYEKIIGTLDKKGTWIPTDEEWDSVKSEYDYKSEFGFIAQDVRRIPELSFLVSGDEVDEEGNQTPLGLNYQGIFVVAVKAIQELNTELQAEKEKTRALEDKVEALEDHLTRFTVQVTARLAALESQK
jgi:hypothetical protein